MIVEFMWTFHNRFPNFIVIGSQDVCEEMEKLLVVSTSLKREHDTVKEIRDVGEMIMIWSLNMIATEKEMIIVDMMTDIVPIADIDLMSDTDHMMTEGEGMIKEIAVEIDTTIVDPHQGPVPHHEDDNCLLYKSLLFMHLGIFIMHYDGADLQVYKGVLLDIHNCVDDHLFGVRTQYTRIWVVVAVRARLLYLVQIEQRVLSCKIVR